MAFEEIQEQTGRKRQDSPLVVGDEHIPVATQTTVMRIEKGNFSGAMLVG